MSLTDGGIQPTMPVTPTGVNNGGWGGFGGDGWWIILFFIVLFGWGGNGFGVAFVSGAAAPHAQSVKTSAKTNARASSFFLIISHSY